MLLYFYTHPIFVCLNFKSSDIIKAFFFSNISINFIYMYSIQIEENYILFEELYFVWKILYLPNYSGVPL